MADSSASMSPRASWAASARYRGTTTSAAKRRAVSAYRSRRAAAASGALKGAIDTAAGKAGARVKFGLGCAALQLPNVSKIVDGSTSNLKRSADAAAKINSELKI